MADPTSAPKSGNGTGDAAPRIGVYVCHCGTNIAGKVDTAAVARPSFTESMQDHIEVPAPWRIT